MIFYQGYLAISDIWGQKYLHFTEVNQTALEPGDDVVDSDKEERFLLDSPALFNLRTMRMPIDVVFLLTPQERSEGAYPVMIPVYDYYNFTEKTSDEAILAYNDRLHMVSWDLDNDETSV